MCETTYELCSQNTGVCDTEGSVNMEESEERYWYIGSHVLKLPSTKDVCIATMAIAVGIAMVVTGALYNEECVYSRATQFLIVMGSFALVLIVSAFMTSFLKEGYYNLDWYKSLWRTIACFGYFIIITWGAVEVFGKYWV